MEKTFNLTIKQTIESYGFWGFFRFLDDNKQVTAFGAKCNNGGIVIKGVIECDSCLPASVLKTARLQFEELEDQREALREAEIKLAQDNFNYLKMVTDDENIDELVELGLALIDITKRTHGIADFSTEDEPLPRDIEKSFITNCLRFAAFIADNSNKTKQHSVNDAVDKILDKINEYLEKGKQG